MRCKTSNQISFYPSILDSSAKVRDTRAPERMCQIAYNLIYQKILTMRLGIAFDTSNKFNSLLEGARKRARSEALFKPQF